MESETKIDGRDILVFVSSKNKKGKMDATGAFIPESDGFAKFHNIPDENVIHINCVETFPKIRAQYVVDEMLRRSNAGLRAIVFFGHGWPNGIQFGFHKNNVGRLAKAIWVCSAVDVKIGLFACLTAENSIRDSERKKIGPATNGGFADLLRDNLVMAGITKGWVDAHKTVGHATWNPYVVRFLCEGVMDYDLDDPHFDAVGGGWIVEPRTKYWSKWVDALKSNKDGFRWRYLFEEEINIKRRLEDA